jgi:mannose-6-phosphate isomerase-like protein (cupin superfamily)
MYFKQNDASDVHETPNAYDGEGVIFRRNLFRQESKLPVGISVWELEPGTSEGHHAHGGDEELEEIYCFLEGEGVMSVDGKDVPIVAGDSIMVPPGVDHGFRNTGNSLLKLVLIWGKPQE